MSGEEGTTLLTTNYHYHLESLSGEVVSRSVSRDELVVLAPAVVVVVLVVLRSGSSGSSGSSCSGGSGSTCSDSSRL